MSEARISKGYKRTEVGMIPDDWEHVQLTSVARLESGHTPSRRVPQYWDGCIPWVSLHDTGELNGREIYSTVQTISSEGLKHSSARLLPEGTVVFSRTATVGKTTVLGQEMATSQDFANFICGPRVHNHFLVYLFRFMAPEWKKLMAGSIHNTVYMPTFLSLKVTLPPKIDQEKIATALADVDALIGSLELLLTKKRQIKQGSMQELLTGKRRLPGFEVKTGFKTTEIGRIPMDWELKKLGQLITRTEYGTSSKSRLSGSIPVLRMGNLQAGKIDWDNLVYTDNEDDITKYLLAYNDILFNRTNTIDLVGKTSIYKSETPAVFAGYLIRFAADAHLASPDYLNFIMNTPVARKYSQLVLSIAVGQANINAEKLKTYPIPTPSLPEQSAIAAILSDMDVELEALESKLEKARQVKQGMMQQLLTGKIRLVTPTAASSSAVVATTSQSNSGHTKVFNEAVIIAVLANHFANEQFPMTRFRYTKLSYLLHRHVERKAPGYLKKAAGPYDPSTRYGGSEKIALQKQYVRTFGKGFLAGDQIAQAEEYFLKWYGPEPLNWLKQFYYAKSNELELWATVDMSCEDLRRAGKPVTVQGVKQVIASAPEWLPKLDRSVFSDMAIAKAIQKCDALFGEAHQ